MQLSQNKKTPDLTQKHEKGERGFYVANAEFSPLNDEILSESPKKTNQLFKSVAEFLLWLEL